MIESREASDAAFHAVTSPNVKQGRGLRQGLNVIDHHQLSVEDVAVVHREMRVQRFQPPGRFEVRRGLIQAPESLVSPASLEKRPCVVGRPWRAPGRTTGVVADRCWGLLT